MKIGLFIDEDKGRARVIRNLKTQFKKYKPTYVEDVCVSDKFLKTDGFDLVVLDYAGLTSIPGNSLGEHYARYVNKYAEDHLNTLIVYVTVMGAHYLKDEGVNLEGLLNIKWCNYEDVELLYRRFAEYKMVNL